MLQRETKNRFPAILMRLKILVFDEIQFLCSYASLKYKKCEPKLTQQELLLYHNNNYKSNRWLYIFLSHQGLEPISFFLKLLSTPKFKLYSTPCGTIFVPM